MLYSFCFTLSNFFCPRRSLFLEIQAEDMSKTNKQNLIKEEYELGIECCADLILPHLNWIKDQSEHNKGKLNRSV